MTSQRSEPPATPLRPRPKLGSSGSVFDKRVRVTYDGVFANLTGISNDDIAEMTRHVMRYRKIAVGVRSWVWPFWRDNDVALEDLLEHGPERRLEVSVGLGDLREIVRTLRRLGYNVESPERKLRERAVDDPDLYGLREALQSGRDGVIEVERGSDVVPALQIILTDTILETAASRPLAYPSDETVVIVCGGAAECRVITKACRQINRFTANLPDGDIDSRILSFNSADRDECSRGLTIVTDFRAIADYLPERVGEEHSEAIQNVCLDAGTLIVVTDNDLEDPRHHDTLSTVCPTVRRLLIRFCPAARRELDDELGRWPIGSSGRRLLPWQMSSSRSRPRSKGISIPN